MSIDHNRIKVADLEKELPNKILITNTAGELAFSDMYNALDCVVAGKVLDARQGKELKDLIDNINTLLLSDNLNLDTVQELVDAIETVQTSLNSILVNDLTTGGITKALTAEMGKTLKGLIDNLTTVVNDHLVNTDAHEELFVTKEDKAQKGIANGYAPLDSLTKLASQYLDIVNDLVTGGATSLLSAEQGKVLQLQITAINSLLASDNINLDTVQKLVDAIETVQTSLGTILVNDLTTGGITKALTAEMGKLLQETKVDKVAGKSLLSDTEIARLATLSNYTHPVNHPPSIITQDTNNRFVTDAEKAIWDAKQSALGFTPENSVNKNAANGYAGLGSDGKLLSSQLPSITISNTFVVASQAAMQGLTVEMGDIAVRTDLNKSFILKGTDPTVLGDWQELLTPTDSVSTVFGRNGSVTAQTGDYTADQITETATRKFQTANQQAFNDATSSIQSQLNTKATDSNVVHKTGIESITGQKVFDGISIFSLDSNKILLDVHSDSDATGSTGIHAYNENASSTAMHIENYNGTGLNISNSDGVGIELTNSGATKGIDIQNGNGGTGIEMLSRGTGISIYDDGGVGINVINNDYDQGIKVTNATGGQGIKIQNQDDGAALLIDSGIAATGNALTIKSFGTTTLTINKEGEVNAAKLVKTGGTSSQFLKADGTVDSSTYATTASPTFTGTVFLPSTTSIGNVSSTELGYVDGATSNIQTQLNTKATDSNVVHKTGNESIYGDKSFNNNVYISSLESDQNLLSIHSDSDTTNVSAINVYIENESSRGVVVDAQNGEGIRLNVNSAGSGNALTMTVDASQVTYIDRYGNISAQSIIKSGGTSSQFLKADGSVDSTTYQPFLANPITGTGTINYLSKFTGAGVQSSSQIFDNGTNIGIGTNSPYRKFHIDGAGSILRVGPFYGIEEDRDYIDIIAGGTTSKVETSNEEFLINNLNPSGMLGLQTSVGNVGIGTTVAPVKLTIKGAGVEQSAFLLNNTNYSPTAGIIFSQGDNGDFSIGRYGEAYLLDIKHNGNVLVGTTTDNGVDKLQVAGSLSGTSASFSSSVQVGNNASLAAATNVGAIRYRTSGNNSYADMCMQTGASTYEWVNIMENNW